MAYSVLSTNGDTRLGGTDMDNLMIQYIEKNSRIRKALIFPRIQLAHQRVREAAEKAKIELSTTTSLDINLPFITATQEGPKHLIMTITRS